MLANLKKPRRSRRWENYVSPPLIWLTQVISILLHFNLQLINVDREAEQITV